MAVFIRGAEEPDERTDLQNNRIICYSEPAADSYSTAREFHRGDTIAANRLPDCRIKADILLP